MSFSESSLNDFLRQSASNNPTPGGGAVAALAGALGACMASMVANFTIDKPQFAEHQDAVSAALKKLRPLIEDFRIAVDDDASAFSGIADAYKLPKQTDDQKAARKTAIQNALAASMKVPLRVLRCCGETADLLPDIARRGNPNLLSDAAVAAYMLEAAAKAALVNVLANSTSLQTDEAREAEREGKRIAGRVADIAKETEAIIEQRK